MSALTAILIGIAVIAILAAIFDRLKEYSPQKQQTTQHTATPIKQGSANSFGQQSLGVLQIRGFGKLTLDAHILHFVMLLPHREWHIPLSTIVRIETPKSHLYKSQAVPLLKVVFRNSSGQEDSIAWRVGNLQEWINAIKAQLSVG